MLFATGRLPNTKGLGLEAAGVELDAYGAVRVDGSRCSSVPNIYAVGDVTNRINLTPVAIPEGAAVATTLFGGVPTVPRSQRRPVRGVQPPVDRHGRTDRGRRAPRVPRDRDLQHALQAAQAHAHRPRRDHVDEARGRSRDRPRARLPHGRRRAPARSSRASRSRSSARRPRRSSTRPSASTRPRPRSSSPCANRRGRRARRRASRPGAQRAAAAGCGLPRPCNRTPVAPRSAKR